MWFTFAFFAIPIAIFLLYRGLSKRDKNSKAKLIWATILILIPVIFLVVQKRNEETLAEDLIGTFYSKNDTLIFQQDRTFLFKHLDTITKKGKWDLDIGDQLIVSLKTNSTKVQELELIYQSGLPRIASDPYDLDNNNKEVFLEKNETNAQQMAWAKCGLDKTRHQLLLFYCAAFIRATNSSAKNFILNFQIKNNNSSGRGNVTIRNSASIER